MHDIERLFVIETDKKTELNKKIEEVEEILDSKLENIQNKSFEYRANNINSDNENEALKLLYGSRKLSRYMDMKNTINEVKYFLNTLGEKDVNQSDEGQTGAKLKDPIINVAKTK